MIDVILICILSQLSSFNIYSQKILVHKYTEEEGLPSSMIYSIIQNKDGSMLFATRNGLARYDGKKWVTEWKNLLPSRSLRGILFNENGNIWLLATGSPVALFKHTNNQWQSELTVPNELEQVFPYDYIPFAVNSNNSLKYMSVIPNKHFIYYVNNAWKTIDFPNIDFDVFDTISYNNEFFLATNQGIYTYDDRSSKFNKLQIDLTNECVKKIVIDKDSTGKNIM